MVRVVAYLADIDTLDDFSSHVASNFTNLIRHDDSKLR